MSDKSQRFWSGVGKLSALVLLLGGVVGLYKQLFPKGPSVRARVEIHHFSLPPDLASALDAIRAAQSPSSLERSLMDAVPQDQQVEFPMFRVANHLGESFDQLWTERWRYSFDRYKYYLVMEVSNAGNQPARDVMVDLPLSGIAKLVLGEEPAHMREVDGKIALGEVRPGGTAWIGLWATRDSYLYPGVEIRLSHAAGTGRVSWGDTTFGVRAFVARHLGIISFYLIMFVALLCLMIAELSKSLARSGQSNPTDGGPQTPPAPES